MTFQIAYSAEIQILFYLIPVTLGVQMAIYFYIQYYRTRAAKLRLNRVLLSFGTFTLLIILGALSIMVDRLFGNNSTESFLRKLGFSAALLSPLGFMAFIAIPEFKKIINVKAAWVLLALSVIPIITLFIVGTRSPIFPPMIAFTIVNGYYMIQFQMKMIRISLGNIRKKLLQTLIGELIALSSLPFAVSVGLSSPGSSIEIWFFIGVAILVTGFLIMFVAANDFPPFLEFEWALNLRKLFIINQNSNKFLYIHNFENVVQTDVRSQMRDHIFSGGIKGIEKLVGEVTGVDRGKISRIDQKDAIILLEYGKIGISIIYALVVKQDLLSLRYFLTGLKQHFESFYKNILTNLEALHLEEGQERLFKSFDRIITRLSTQ